VRAYLAAGAIALAIWPATAIHAAEPRQEVIGRWRLNAVLDGTYIVSIDEKEALKLVGQVFTIGKERARFGRHLCGLTNFETEHVETNVYFKKTDPYVNVKSLALPNPVTVVDISCTSVFIKNKNRIVIFWDGFYFDAVRLGR
jgi:hypothetical protein